MNICTNILKQKKYNWKIPFDAEIRKCRILNQSEYNDFDVGLKNAKISISLDANNLKQKLCSENEKVDIKEA